MSEYSTEIANAIKNFLEEDGWHFSFNEDKGIFKFNLSIRNKIKKIEFQVFVNANGYTVYAISPINADADDPEAMAKMAEFVCRANYGIRDGNFELDMRDGEVRYKCYVNCIGGIVPSKKQVQISIYGPSIVFEHYGSGIVELIFGDVTAKDAVEKCEKGEEE